MTTAAAFFALTVAACAETPAGKPAAVAQATPAAPAAAPPPALVKFEIKNGGIPASLTGKPGDAAAGKKIVVGRRLGNCLACHEISTLKNEEFHGNTGPVLDGVAGRLSAAEMRLRLVDATKVTPDTMMPPFYRTEGLNRVRKEFVDKTILSADQIEDVLAFLVTLK
ncbi:MAG: sulfur oxidation c-type cytochrome SoxX [Rhodospirillales bacterium]|nr:sulfur oxidation c-type cytochrome SoxX [Rhodospirillales bacterium]